MKWQTLTLCELKVMSTLTKSYTLFLVLNKVETAFNKDIKTVLIHKGMLEINF